MNFEFENPCNVSDFARKQLEKYGWSEGKGLGKEENGITKPIKASMKFDNEGIGHNFLDAWTSMWWCDAFNAASKRIKVVETKTGVSLKSKKSLSNDSQPSSLRLTTKKFVKAGAVVEKEEISSLTMNTKVPYFSKCSSTPLKRRHVRLMEQDAIYAQKKKRKTDLLPD